MITAWRSTPVKLIARLKKLVFRAKIINEINRLISLAGRGVLLQRYTRFARTPLPANEKASTTFCAKSQLASHI